MDTPAKHPTMVAITGASGSILGFTLVKTLLQLQEPVELIVSTRSFPVILEEMNLALPPGREQEAQVLAYLQLDPETYGHLLRCHNNNNLGASPASGTHLTRGMAVIPCSMTTLGKMANGISDNLVARAADVTLKEKRRLVVVPRESPLSTIHLENMARLDRAGAVIIPPVLSFYQEAFGSLDGQIAYTVGKVLDQLGVHHHNLFPRWTELSAVVR